MMEDTKKKIVAHVLNTNSYSGAENVIMQIIEGTKDDYDGVYVTKDGPIVKMLKERKIQYYLIKELSTKEIKKMCAQLHPDVIHAHDYTASCICALSHGKVPILSHLHNNSSWIRTLHPYSILYFLCAHKFSKILLVSQAIGEEYIFGKWLKRKFVEVGNPISREPILGKVKSEDFQKKYDIACVARLTEAKNPKRFVNVIAKMKAQMPEVKCLWVGNGELKEEVVAYAKEQGVDENIDFIGFQENPYPFLASAKIFLLTSLWEGFGLSAFEAMTLGLPAFVSKVGGLTQIVNDSCGKLCESDEDFASCLEVLKNEELYVKLSQGAIKRAEELENKEEYMKKMKEIWNQIFST